MHFVKEMGSTDESSNTVWAVHEGEVPYHESTTICSWLEDDGIVEEQECERHEDGPVEYDLLEAQVRLP